MATQHQSQASDGATAQSGSMTAFIDRWIYVLMAVLFFATVLVGFVPDSLMKIELVRTGVRPPFPMILHVHAVLMGTWILLLLTQTGLMATGRRAMHMQTGVAGMVLMPAIVLPGIVLVPTMYGQVYEQFNSAPPEAFTALAERVNHVGNLALLQFRAAIAFPLLVILALRARRNRPDIHKRLMILATSVPLPAAIDRITWIPHTMPESSISVPLYTFLWIAPMFLWDLHRQRKVHPAYWIFLAVYLPLALIGQLLWNTPFWLSTVPGLLGQG
ncbi:hypothetical protein [Altererythrobacter sp. MF3-039]|uniref:hypothetical protein n=1 Tax=Altererythrobacter sp. MF3-039 TaxID=3252901 RepID=UPI00390C79FD